MEGAAQSLLRNVGQRVAVEFRLLRGVDSKVAELRLELATMNSVLRMQSEAEDGAVDHFLQEWMKQVRELSYDAEDYVDLYIFRIKCRSGDGFLHWCKRLFVTCFPRRRLAGDIEAFRARAVAISERHARYGVSRDALRSSRSAAPVMTVAASLQVLRRANDPGQFVGIQDQAKTLAEKVKEGGGDGRRKVFSIVGFGGLGKTTLAMQVCRQLEADFDRQAQVSVSQAFAGGKDVQGLLKRIVQQIVKPKAYNEKGIKEEDPVGDIGKLDVHELAIKLEELLNEKRYLIVIDDVWTVAAWNAIQTKLPNSRCGSRILVTTRIEMVARECSASEDYIYQMKPLNLKYSRELFLSRAFGSISASCPKELRAIMDKILKKCGGLPLAIVSIASLLARYNSPESKHMWERIHRSIGSQMESNPTLEGMRQIITHSYNYLPHAIKCCMMYLSIFPEDYMISKKRLLNRWIAEGLIAEKRGLTLMEIAEAYFNELLSRSMIDPSPSIVSYYDRVEMCRVHDMMLEVMVSESMEANFVSLVGGQYQGMSYDMIRRLSLHGGEQGTEDAPSKRNAEEKESWNGIDGMNVQHVRSLTTFQSEGHKLLLNRLDKFKLLRVLDLEDCKDLKNVHLRYICRMYLLKFLSLRGTDVSLMPPEVGDLEYLQTLDVSETCLEKLPNTLIKLNKLERLMFSHKVEKKWLTLWILPKGISKMKALREVSRVGIEDVEVAKEMGSLQHLERLFVYLNKTSKQAQEIRQELCHSLTKMSSLQWLDVGELCKEHEDMDYLIDLEMPPQLLRYLRFAGTISRIPDWVGSLAYLAEFTISRTRLVADQPFEVLCKAPNLKSILFQMRFYSDNELVARTAHKFRELKNMRAIYAFEYPKVFRFEEESMPMLETLEVDFRGWEKSIVGVEHLTNLKEVHLSGYRDNSSLILALDELKAESTRRLDTNQLPFTVGVRYY